MTGPATTGSSASTGSPVTGTGEWRRLSPRMLLVHPIAEVGRALPAIAGVFLAGRGSGGSAYALGIAVTVSALAVLRWFTTRFVITPEQVRLRTGLLRRKVLSTPRERVRTVDVTSHALHRALGLARVVIGTGTSDRKGRDRLVLDGLGAAQAAALRGELLHRPGIAAAGTAAPAGDAVTADGLPSAEDMTIVQADPRWLRYAPFTLTGAVTGLAVLGVGWRIVSEGHVDVHRLALVRTIGHRLDHTPLALDIGLGLLGVVAFVVLASTVGYVLAFWRFRLSRHSGGTLHVSRGLITSRATSIERRRLRGAELSEPLLLRSVGGARCLAIATGLRVGRGGERGGEILLPPAPHAVAVGVAAAVLDTAAPFTATLARHPPAARRRRVTRAVVPAVALAAMGAGAARLADLPVWVEVLPAMAIVAAVGLGVDRYRSLGHALVDGYLVTRYGSIVRRHCAITSSGVIGWNLRASFFQRRLGVVSLVATTAAGRQGYPVADVAADDAVAFADSVTPGLLLEFADEH